MNYVELSIIVHVTDVYLAYVQYHFDVIKRLNKPIQQFFK